MYLEIRFISFLHLSGDVVVNKLLIIILFCASFAATTSIAPAEDKPEGDKVLFERPIGGQGQRLVVTRGPNRDPSLFSFWKKEGGRDLSLEWRTNLYEVHAELRSPNAAPLLLASFLRKEYKGVESDRGVGVLDTLIAPGTIVLAIVEGADIKVWRIGIFQWDTCLSDALGGWSLMQARYRLDEKMVGLKLGRTQDNRLTLLVIEKGTGQRTFYEEVDTTSLQFKLVRQWHE